MWFQILVSTPLKTIADHLTSPRSAEDSGSGGFEPSKLLFLWSEPSVFPKPVDRFVVEWEFMFYYACWEYESFKFRS